MRNLKIKMCGASAIEKQHISNAVANPDIPGRSVLVNLVSLVAAERPKVPLSAQEFFFLSDRILLHGEIAVGEVGVGEISDWGS